MVVEVDLYENESCVLDELNLPVALRKEPRATARKPPQRYDFEHDIANYMSYDLLSTGYRAFIASLQYVVIPTDWSAANRDPNGMMRCWRRWQPLRKIRHVSLYHFQKGRNQLTVNGSTLYTVKQDPNGKIEKYEARLAANGYSQTYEIDYDETFAPVAKMSTVRTLISCAANFGWPLY
jgi:hypothetical protein